MRHLSDSISTASGDCKVRSRKLKSSLVACLPVNAHLKIADKLASVSTENRTTGDFEA
jgi:hypothetical protein